MTIEGIIAISFVVSLLLSAFTPIHPAAYGCLLPFLAAGAVFLMVSFWPSGSSTESLVVPFAFVLAAFGTVPGAYAGAGIKIYLLK